MTPAQQLYAILEQQRLHEDGPELAALRQHRAKVEEVLHRAFGYGGLTIRYAGSKAKDTMIKEAFDLDIVAYFHHDNAAAGDTIGEIFRKVAHALDTAYEVKPRRSAIRLHTRETGRNGRYIHIDVVPGRFIDARRADCFIHQNEGPKAYIKTNLDKHVGHIRDSGVIDTLKLMKLMRVRYGADIKQFALDLTTIEILKAKAGWPIDRQMSNILATIASAHVPVPIQDPANPCGNDTVVPDRSSWTDLRAIAGRVHKGAERSGWMVALGDVARSVPARPAVVSAAAKAINEPTMPWCY